MHTKLYLIIILCLLLFGGCFSQKKTIVYLKDKRFIMEIAKTTKETKSGLMHRESLDSDKGMLFVYEEEKPHSFWMKNTLIPLDIIWLNKNKSIVHITKNTQPCYKGPCPSISPKKNASYVIEINASISDKLRLKVGDIVRFNIK